MGTKVGRNDRCPCGSGKKYKHCHGSHQQEVKEQQAGKWVTMAVVGLLVALGLVGTAVTILTAQPKVKSGDLTWSTEHGHWHDANGKKYDASTAGGKAVPPPPAEAAPPGKVWNAEHGHYHDANNTSGAPDAADADGDQDDHE